MDQKEFKQKVESIWEDCLRFPDGKEIDCFDFINEVFDTLITRLIELGELPNKEWCRRG